MSAQLVDRLAIVAGEAWWRACERPKAWAQIPADERATFRACAEYAVRAARAGQREPEAVAQAMCAGFYRDAPLPRSWGRLGELQRDVFRTVARAVIAAGQALKAERAAA